MTRAELAAELREVEAELARLKAQPPGQRVKGWYGATNKLRRRAKDLKFQLDRATDEEGSEPARRQPMSRPTLPPRDYREAQRRRAGGSDDDRPPPSGSPATAGWRYQRSWENWLRALSDEPDALDPRDRERLVQVAGWERELRDQGVATGGQGGYTVPPEFLGLVTDAMKNTGGLLYAARIVPTQTGANIGWPTADDTAVSGTILGEGASAGASVDIVFGQKSLTSYLYSSKPVKASIQLVQDTAIDFAGWLGKRLAVRVARAVNAHLMNGLGPGSSQPTGLLPGVTVGKQGIVGQTTTIIYQDVIDLIHSVDVAYRDQDLAPDASREGHVGFMCSDGLLKALRGIKDPALGALILNAGRPNTLAGWPLLVSPDMPVPAASAKTLLFGCFPQAYTARRVNDLIVLKLSERVMDQLQLQWIAFDRWDGIPDDPGAVKAYQHSAS